jgi:tetratricopeptide (TPR) repeat protein
LVVQSGFEVSWLHLLISIVLLAGQSGDQLSEQVRLAREKMVGGEFLKAAAIYRELLKIRPEDSGLRLNLVVALEKAGQPSAAVPEALRVTRANPSSAPAWLLLGLAYQQLIQPAKAIAPLREALRLEPKNTTALLELADAELTTGDSRGAVRDFGGLVSAEPASPKAWEGLGRAYLSLSEDSYKRIESQAADSPYRLALLARVRASEGRQVEALRLYAAAIAVISIPGVHKARAAIYRETKHDDWATIEDEREARVVKPDCAQRPAACAYIAGNWLGALTASAKVHSVENLYWASLAGTHLAEDSFAKLAGLPDSEEIHSVLADSYQRMGRRLDAVAEWRRAALAMPQDRLVQARLAESLFLAREYAEAESILRTLVQAQPENGDLQYLLGNVLLQTKRDEDSLQHLLAATKLLPGSLPAREALGRVYLDLDKPDLAVENLEKALPLDQGSISYALNSAYRKLGRQEDAKKALARYQALSKYGSPDGSETVSEIPAP